MHFSLIMSVYRNDNPSFVSDALDSVLVKQSVIPSEVVLVEDGPIPIEVESVIHDFLNRFPEIISVIKLPVNKGLGNALKVGTESASYDIIARMDSDDLCYYDRFEKQLSFMSNHPEVDICGGQMTEFIDDPQLLVGRRRVPLSNESIQAYMKARCPMNHVTVMFRKAAVERAGGYLDWFWNEDYYLWIRMLLAGCVFANLEDDLVNCRTGLDQYARRGGIKYFQSEARLQGLMLKNRIISFPRYCFNVIARFALQVIMPNNIRGWFFKKFARS